MGVVEHSVLRNHDMDDLKITITLNHDGIHIHDNGCTLPVKLDESVGLSMAELMLTTNRFSSPKDEIYCLQAAVALSSTLSIKVHIGKYTYCQSYAKGYPNAPLEYQTGSLGSSNVKTATDITFVPCKNYFGCEWHCTALLDYLSSEIDILIGPLKSVTVDVCLVTKSTIKSGR
jgi:DNA gyrase/topoisomerase IV subunit B